MFVSILHLSVLHLNCGDSYLLFSTYPSQDDYFQREPQSKQHTDGTIQTRMCENRLRHREKCQIPGGHMSCFIQDIREAWSFKLLSVNYWYEVVVSACCAHLKPIHQPPAPLPVPVEWSTFWRPYPGSTSPLPTAHLLIFLPYFWFHFLRNHIRSTR